jgi:hypothetical protein
MLVNSLKGTCLDNASAGKLNILITSLDFYKMRHAGETDSHRNIIFVPLPCFSEAESLDLFQAFEPLSKARKQAIILCCGHPRSLLAMYNAFRKVEKRKQIPLDELLPIAVEEYSALSPGKHLPNNCANNF